MAIDEDETERAQDPAGFVLLQASVSVIEGEDLGRTFPLGRRPVVLGTGADCDVKLRDSAVSKRHLELALVGASVRLRDVGSTNGTWVGAHRVIESLVPTGSVVRLGRTVLHLRGEDDTLVLEPSARDGFGELRGTSVAMRQLYAVLERVAPTEGTVLVDGETGTGKELVARALHAHSPRARGPFVVFDGSAVAPELVEAQLFGHRKGAFTGATADHRGVFESARGGTVFLDELDSLSVELQSKLLRVLETRRLVRVGEVEARPVDVRIVAATGRSPEELAATGALRRDLYFRLAVVRLTLPALRERIEDLPALAAHLLERLGRPLPVAPGPALDRLRAHAWPGNVRELRNVLERALMLAPMDARSIDDLPIRIGARAPLEPADPLFVELPHKEAKERVIERWEREYLRQAFERGERNLSRTARDVGLTRLHLRTLLRKHGLVDEAEGD